MVYFKIIVGEGEGGEEGEDSDDDDRTIREVTLEDIRRQVSFKKWLQFQPSIEFNMEIKIMLLHFSRIKAKMKTVRQIMIEGEDIEIGSDSDVSDTSQISIQNHSWLRQFLIRIQVPSTKPTQG